LSDHPRGGFFVFDGVMVLAAGSVLPHRQDVYHKFGFVGYCSRQCRSGPSGLSGYRHEVIVICPQLLCSPGS
jgi:hypothetical protein